MSDFDKIIKEKVEQFEVPYNDAHWAEMEGKLNTIKATKIKTTFLSAAAALFFVAGASYLLYQAHSTTKTENTISENTQELESKHNNTPKNKPNINPSSSNEDIKNNNSENINNVIPTEESSVNKEKVETQELTPENKVIDNDNNLSSTLDPKENNSSINLNSDFIVYNNKVCLGEIVSFESMNNDRPVSYLWNFGDGNISYETNPKHKYKTNGIFDVTLTLIDKQSGTEHTSIQRDIVNILAQPNANFNYIEESVKHDDNKLKYPYTTFKVKTPQKGNTYNWSFGNGEKAKGTKAKTIHKKANNYLVNLSVKNSSGCMTQTEKTITIKNNFILFAPNAIRINPNNPENGIFMPKALLEWNIDFEMIITDKAGRTIYKTSDKNEGWNGKMNNNGQQMEEGFYFWKIITKGAEGNSHYHQGEVQLIK